jgi:predicted nucleotidyltransferase
VDEALLALRDLLSRRYGVRLRDYRLFGSYARGDWGPGSDVDVLVVIADLSPRERREVFDLAWDVFSERQIRLAPLALATTEWDLLESREYRLAAEIAQDGLAIGSPP